MPTKCNYQLFMKGGIFMCPENNNTNTNRENCCLADILEVIVKLQDRSEKFDCLGDGCDRPYLGPTPSTVCYNTRPVTFYRCCDGDLWAFPYTLNGATGSSTVFRCEHVEGCCATCRVLAPNPDTATAIATPYVPTESFFTINLNCVGALRCLPDTFIACS